jgi:autotransporter-associated beta strand protein
LQLGNGATSGALNAASSISVGAGASLGFKRSNVLKQGLDFGPVISGAGGVLQSGPGTTILTGTNTYTGASQVTAGTLQIGDGGLTGSVSAASALSVGAGATLAFSRSDTLAQGVDFNPLITGAGGVTQLGSGTLILLGANTYSGTTTAGAGILQLGTGGTEGTLNPTGRILVNAGGTFRFNRGTTIVQGTDFGTPITGAGSVEQAGSGTVVFTGANTYTGGTTIRAGTLQLGTASTTGSLSGSGALQVDASALLVFNRSNTLLQGTDFGAVISGSGAVTQMGAGTTVLTGSNTYSGATTVTAGTLQLGNGAPSGALNAASSISVGSGASLGF